MAFSAGKGSLEGFNPFNTFTAIIIPLCKKFQRKSLKY